MKNNLLLDDSFARTLVDSIPSGLIVVDRHGRVRAVNNIYERVLMVNRQAAIGKGAGNVLGCLHASDHPKGCGYSKYCEHCEVQKLTFKVFATKQMQKANAHFQLITGGQVKDLTLFLSALPFTFNNESFSILMIENLNTIGAFYPKEASEGFWGLVGCSRHMQELIDTIKQVAPTDAAVLIQGESGTGKELAALAVHKESKRAHKYFVPVNCSALPEGLLETELFGHLKGAFTGAHRDRKGRFEVADGGSIFLDEVGELSPTTQVKLLRVLQDGSFEPVGSEHTVRVNVRVISATNKKIEEEVLAERFRSDPYYRLAVMPIRIHPLRNRKEDIPLLVKHFIVQFSDEARGNNVVCSDSALSLLMSHSWPGNVRELINTVRFALAKCQGRRIQLEHLPPTLLPYMAIHKIKRQRESKLKTTDVFKALAKANGNKVQAAEALSVSRSTRYRFFAKHRIGPPGS